jgi:uncharacterized membrane protein (UPF0127 family)
MRRVRVVYATLAMIFFALFVLWAFPYIDPRPNVSVSVNSASSAASQLTIPVAKTAASTSTPRVPQSRSVVLAGQTIHVSIADTPALQEKGLGGRTSLAPNEGMLFVFPESGEYAFWMKDMRFSIDIVWLSDDGAVVYMAQNVSPDTYPQTFIPNEPARYVLELPAGWAKAYTMKIGDSARL